MYSLGVREHVMIAHSFKGDIYGPAQKLHGATYVVDVEMKRQKLDDNGLVVDIGRAHESVKAVLAELNFQNLDDLAVFTDQNTTTEFLARYIFDKMEARTRTGELGPGSEGLEFIKITLHESHVAWASFEGPVQQG